MHMRLAADLFRLCCDYLSQADAAYVRGDWSCIAQKEVFAAREGLHDLLSLCASPEAYFRATSLRTVKCLWFSLRVAFQERRERAVQTAQILKWLMAKGVTFTQPTKEHVALRGDAEMLRALLPVDPRQARRLGFIASAAGNVECLLVLEAAGTKFGTEVSQGALRFGHLDVLQFVEQRSLPWDFDECEATAGGGNLPCLQFMVSHHADKWTAYPQRVVETGSVDVVRYMHERGMVFDDKVCDVVATRGYFDVLKFLVQEGCFYNAHMCALAARQNRLDIVQLMRDKWDARTCKEAAAHRDGAILRFAFAHGCEWDIETCNTAASMGNLDNLRFAHANGCAWGAETCEAAIIVDYLGKAPTKPQLDVLEYLVSEGCPLSRAAFERAAASGDVDIFKFLHTHGCPHMTYKLYIIAMASVNLEVMRYMLDNQHDFVVDENARTTPDAIERFIATELAQRERLR